MTTFTDKELIKEIKERISSLDVRDNIERRAYEIALASLEEDPVAWLHSDNGLGIPAITRSKNIADSWLSKGWYVQPLYIAKPVPVVPDARPSLNNGIVGFDEGWNACRAAMLQSQDNCIKDGWISCSERMPDTKTAVLVAVEFDRKGDWRMKWATYIPGHPDANDGWIIPGASWKPSHWMPLPEPPQEAK